MRTPELAIPREGHREKHTHKGLITPHLSWAAPYGRFSDVHVWPVLRCSPRDLLIRHSGANHKRETIAFSKRRQSALERVAVFAVWVNFQKSRHEKARDATPAQWLGLVDRKLTTEDILAARHFPSRIPLPLRWRQSMESDRNA